MDRQVWGQMILVPQDPCPHWNVKLKLLILCWTSSLSDAKCSQIEACFGPNALVASIEAQCFVLASALCMRTLPTEKSPISSEVN